METYESRRSLHKAADRRSHQAKETEALEAGVSVRYSSTDDASANNVAEEGAPQGQTPVPVVLTWKEVLREEIVQPKWRLLILLCFMPFGTYYTYDFPSSIGTGDGATIQGRFAAEGKEYNQQMNQALYSVYSYPNTVLAFFGGILIDRLLGLRRSILLFTSLVLCGSVVFYVGVLTVQYPVILFGRLLFGLGGESLGVSQSALVARWFGGGRGLSFAFGISISCVRLGSSFNFMFSPTIADQHGVQTACLVGCFLCAFSSMCCIVLCVCDLYYENKGTVRPQPMGRSDAEILPRMKTMLRQVGKLPAQYWLLCGICVSLYGSDFPFVGVAKNFFEVKFHLSATRASDALSYYQLTSAIASPLVGAVIDRIGRNAYVLAFASVAFFSSHLSMTVSDIDPVAAMVLMGVYYSILVSSLWPSVPYVVSESLSGVAFGAMMSIQNIGSATIPLVTGAVLDRYTPSTPTSAVPLANSTTPVPEGVAVPDVDGFIVVEVIMMGFAVLSLTLCVVLVVVDKRRTGGVLCSNPLVRARLFEDFLFKLDEMLRRSAQNRNTIVVDTDSQAFVDEDGDDSVASSTYLGAEDVHFVVPSGREVGVGSAIYSPVAAGDSDGARRQQRQRNDTEESATGGRSYRNTANRFVEGPNQF